jgi:hypothetical protein
MYKILSIMLLLLVTSAAIGQVIGRVDKRTKQFTVAPDQKMEYRVFGYQYPSVSTKKMICFSSNANDVGDNYSKCPLGSYYDTNRMNATDNIYYVGVAGSFGKMSYVAGNGKKTIFYLPKSSFVIK